MCDESKTMYSSTVGHVFEVSNGTGQIVLSAWQSSTVVRVCCHQVENTVCPDGTNKFIIKYYHMNDACKEKANGKCGKFVILT